MQLARHQLVRLIPEAWCEPIAKAGDEVARASMLHWATHSLPLVVARQAPDSKPSTHTLGIALPARWERRRISVQVPPAHVAGLASFPQLRRIAIHFEPAVGDALTRLSDELDWLGLHTLVYGSHGWQELTGMRYVNERSDVDLLIAVDDAAAADAACARLAGFAPSLPRLDGELGFPDGTAVAWREWLDWRSGRTEQILLKRVDGVSLASGQSWLTRATGGQTSQCR